MPRRPTPEGRPATRVRRVLEFATMRKYYGAGPLHLLGLLASFALAAAAVLKLIKGSMPVMVVVWFVGAAVVHDLVLLPLYGVVDRTVAGRFPHRRPVTANTVNYVRVPAGISLLLLLVYLPSIFRLATGYTMITALTADGYFVRWLIVTGVLFVLSGIVFVARVGRRRAAAGV